MSMETACPSFYSAGASRLACSGVALPILYGDRLAGKLDATADRKAALLGIDATRQDIPVGKTTSAAVDRQPAAAVAHQLGGRQAARAVPHHRFLGRDHRRPGELAAEYHPVRQAPRPGTQVATLSDLRSYRTLSRAALARAVW